MYRRILVPISHGAASEQGVREGLRLAHVAHAALRFVHVVDELGHANGHAGFSGTVDQYLALLALVDRRGAALAEHARRIAEQAGLRCEVVLRDGSEGSTWDLVAQEARSWRAEVVVMGAKAAEGGGLRPGSVGARILQSSPVPVMAFSPRPSARSTGIVARRVVTAGAACPTPSA